MARQMPVVCRLQQDPETYAFRVAICLCWPSFIEGKESLLKWAPQHLHGQGLEQVIRYLLSESAIEREMGSWRHLFQYFSVQQGSRAKED